MTVPNKIDIVGQCHRLINACVVHSLSHIDPSNSKDPTENNFERIEWSIVRSRFAGCRICFAILSKVRMADTMDIANFWLIESLQKLSCHVICIKGYESNLKLFTEDTEIQRHLFASSAIYSEAVKGKLFLNITDHAGWLNGHVLRASKFCIVSASIHCLVFSFRSFTIRHSLDAVFPKDPLYRLIGDHNFCLCAVW